MSEPQAVIEGREKGLTDGEIARALSAAVREDLGWDQDEYDAVIAWLTARLPVRGRPVVSDDPWSVA